MVVVESDIVHSGRECFIQETSGVCCLVRADMGGTGRTRPQRRGRRSPALHYISNVQHAPYTGVEKPAAYVERWGAAVLAIGNKVSAGNRNAPINASRITFKGDGDNASDTSAGSDYSGD